MATPLDMSRLSQGVYLPPALSSSIVTKSRATNPYFQLATQMPMPGTGVTFQVLDSEPEAQWVEETGEKPVSKSGVSTKTIKPHKVACIEVFSEEFKRDAATLYNELEARLPDALTRKIVRTISGVDAAPASDFTQFSAAKAVAIDPKNAYNGILDVEAAVAAGDGSVTGYALNQKGRIEMLRAVDGMGRPLLVNDVSTGVANLSVLGASTLVSKDVLGKGDDFLGVAGDWSAARYGMVEAVKVKVSDQTTIKIDGEWVSLWQRNMFAVLVEVEVAFDAKLDKFVRLTSAPAAAAPAAK